MAVIETVRLIMSDVGNNNNKFWYGFLHDDGKITSQNGRVGVTCADNEVSANGKHAFDKLVNSKKKKGYSELKTVAQSGETRVQSVAHNDLRSIASSQIKTVKPELQKLIDRLVAANVHKITASTQITYNDATGLFATPLGIVTLDAIVDARNLLVEINKYVSKQDFRSSALMGSVSKFLMLVPQNVGMKLNIEKIFPDLAAIQKQSDLLDSLESSYQALQSQPKKAPDGKVIKEEKVFSVVLDLLEDANEAQRIESFFRQHSHRSHASSRLRIVKIYKLELSDMAKAFENGKKVGNVKRLWHGTKKANLLSILKSGLRCAPPNTAAIAGKMFGNGIYFSDQSTKSLNYAYGYWDGKYEKDCFMLLNDVAMGKEYIPSGPSQSLPKPGYDSTFAMGGRSGVSNNEMIVYKDNQCNITHLVEFAE